MYDLLIKGGEVIDPAQGIRSKKDIGISGGKIAAVENEIASNMASKVIDAKGKIVTPGLNRSQCATRRNRGTYRGYDNS